MLLYLFAFDKCHRETNCVSSIFWEIKCRRACCSTFADADDDDVVQTRAPFELPKIWILNFSIRTNSRNAYAGQTWADCTTRADVFSEFQIAPHKESSNWCRNRCHRRRLAKYLAITFCVLLMILRTSGQTVMILRTNRQTLYTNSYC